MSRRTGDTIARPAARRVPDVSDRGLTLTEMLVAIVVMTVVMVATVSLTVGIHRTDAATRVRAEDTMSAQYALRVMGRALPYALSTDTTGADAMLLGASSGGLAVVIRDPDGTQPPGTALDGLLLVEFEIVDRQLIERRTALDDLPDATALTSLLPLSDGCDTRTCVVRVLVDGVEEGSGLAYLDGAGAAVDPTSATVRTVDITLVVRTDAYRQKTASTHRDRIHLKNR